MLFWPPAVALVAAWNVFRDPAFDYRLLVVGALVPDALDAPFGGARLAHTLVFGVALLVAVMLATRGRRRLRRSLLALPIGILLHLVADGVWTQEATLWWPAFGRALDGPLPPLERAVGLLVAQEIVGLAVLAWFWRRFELSDGAVRSTFLRTGHLPRRLVDPGSGDGPSC